FRVLREPEIFSSSRIPLEEMEELKARLPANMPRIPQLMPISIDPPKHAAIRSPLQKAFSPKAAMGQLDGIKALCAELIDAVAEQGHCDFISAIAEPLPVTVFLRMMGLPVERLAEFRELVYEVLGQSHDVLNSRIALRKVADTLHDTIVQSKQERDDTLLSNLWATEIDGEPITMDLMEDYATLLFIAGLDTVINAMGFAVRHMAENQDLQEKLRGDPGLIPDAVEEMLRRYSFVVPVRRVAHDTTLGDFKLKEGDHLMVHLGGADLDERKFERPDEFDLSRDLKSHVAFGGGPHRCLGMHLARVELHTLYREMLSRLPMWRLDPAHKPTYHTGNIVAFDTLHIRWD
ncbi:MAG: cytochrome P450, partial [Sphingomonadaceae bacterium]|nr:cytochrome P450 [Sphingomonadaceae bacterium]